MKFKRIVPLWCMALTFSTACTKRQATNSETSQAIETAHAEGCFTAYSEKRSPSWHFITYKNSEERLFILEYLKELQDFKPNSFETIDCSYGESNNYRSCQIYGPEKKGKNLKPTGIACKHQTKNEFETLRRVE